MTTFPKQAKDTVAATIRKTVATTRIHAQKISQLESANAANQATIASQGTAITSLTATVSNLLGGNVTISGALTVNGGSLTINGQTLSASQLGFLATLAQMSFVAHPGAGDLTQTNTQLDTLLNELQGQGYMQP